MGTDNLFHKRKAKGRAELSRKGKGKSVSEKILIVCEGGKTEPNYLKEMKKHYKLETASVIEVCGDECGSILEVSSTMPRKKGMKKWQNAHHMTKYFA
ncbi:RloB domain-containing protein [Serratia marcescens]